MVDMLTEISPAKVALRVAARKFAQLTRARRPMQFPPYPAAVAERIEQYHDDVRYATLALAIERLGRDEIAGAFAEVGVYRGVTSSFIHRQAPERRFYLFDTFEGFPNQDLESEADTRFKDTSQQGVESLIGDTRNLEFRKGYFPETAKGLEAERFALVMLDVDLYKPALEVFRFFYPRMVRGGYFFLHDFNSPESEQGIARAAHEFMADKPELLIEIADFHGSAMFRKMAQ
jgi:O-methyltransferase